MKNRAVLLLLSAMLFTAVSCGDTGTAAENTEPTPSSDAPTETVSAYPDDLPADMDLGGKAVNFLYRDERKDEFYADTDTGDLINDALNASIRSVEERLNTDIVLIAKPGHIWEVREGYHNDIINSVYAGDSTYDWVDLMIGNSPVLAQNGIFTDLQENPYIDLSKPWYIPDLAETVAVDNKLFFVSGDASLGYLKCAFCMYFNKKIADQYDLGDIYDTVKDGKWIMDRLMEYASLTASDLDGNGVYDLSDQLGYVNHDDNHPFGYFSSCELKVFDRDNNGDWYFSLGSDHDHSVYEKLYRLMKETQGSYFYAGNNGTASTLDTYNVISSMFRADKIFIISAEMDDVVSQFRDMESPYGILPFPKFDEAQDAYYTRSRSTQNAFSMPITCADQDAAGAVLEALSSSNYQKVTPVYFETAMKAKYSDAPEDAEIFDLIHNSMNLDFGYIYSNSFSGLYNELRGLIEKVDTFSSFVESRSKATTTQLEAYLQAIRDNCAD